MKTVYLLSGAALIAAVAIGDSAGLVSTTSDMAVFEKAAGVPPGFFESAAFEEATSNKKPRTIKVIKVKSNLPAELDPSGNQAR